jgi:hypothetical protein
VVGVHAFDDGPWHNLEQHFIDKTGEVQSTDFAAFFREAMMRKGGNISKNSIFVQFEKSHKSGEFKPRDVLNEFQKQAGSYDIIRGMDPHPSPVVERDLVRLRVLETKSANPLILRLFELHQEERLHETDLASALRAISGFVLRRAITRETTRFYGQWFCAACRELGDAPLARDAQGEIRRCNRGVCGGEVIGARSSTWDAQGTKSPQVFILG